MLRDVLVAKVFMSEASPIEKMLPAQKSVNLRRNVVDALRQLDLADIIAVTLQRAD